ncbi:hypothetical protein D3C87_1732990 [compost metagenome]
MSDLLQTGDEWLSWIRSLAGPQREIVIFQILGDQEEEFNLKGFYRFKDLESGREMELDAESAGTAFRMSIQAYLADLKTALQIPHVRLVRVRMSEPVGMVLKAFFTRRKG